MQFVSKIRHLIGEYSITYFAGFWRSNSLFTQNDREFKNRELQKKFIFQQVGTKIANFADIRQHHNSIFNIITAYLHKAEGGGRRTRILKL